MAYSRAYLQARSLDKGEFYLLSLFATLGMMVMISSNHFLTLYMGLELMSLSLYAMVAIDRESARATEAAMKYFVLGCPRLGAAALWHVHDLWGNRYARNLVGCAGAVS